jgi:hypothetical protein
MAVKLKEFEQMMRKSVERMDMAIARSLRDSMRLAKDLSRSRYMEPKGLDPIEDPPNPPPGPLAIRTGALARTLKIIPPKKIGTYEWRSGLQAGSSRVAYAGAHEKGVVTSPHMIWPVKAKVLSWINPDSGERVFRHSVAHPGSDIPARPYMTPAIKDANPVHRAIQAVRLALSNMLRRG